MSTSTSPKGDAIKPWREEPWPSQGKRLVSSSELAEKLQVQFSENMDHEAVLFEYYKKQGLEKLHYCPDWDYMVIHSLSPEFQACTCDKAELR